MRIYVSPIFCDNEKAIIHIPYKDTKILEMKEKWGSKYPNAIKSWETNWASLSTFFIFPEFIRKIVCTTNVIESFNSQFRRLTKNKPVFPTDDSLLKMMYLAVERVAKKWTRTYSGWDLVSHQLSILFSEVLVKTA